jgi:site-specific DNA-methyltransferase (adenine-specific)
MLAGNCAKVLKSLDRDSVDLTVTSPPYDNLREYKGFELDLPGIIAGLYYVTKPGGVVVWVVADSVQNGSETGTSFKQALMFMSRGFNLHDTMLYAKVNPTPNGGVVQRRYQQAFEYMFVFSKGKPKTFNPLVRPRRNKWNDGRTFRKKKYFNRQKDGAFAPNKDYYEMSYENVLMENIWWYVVGGGNSAEDRGIDHPAIFPEQLPLDHILTWTNKGDLVLDPMVGSGTTCKMAKLAGRNYLGIDIAEEYIVDAKVRVDTAEFDVLEFPIVSWRGGDAILINTPEKELVR